METTLPGVQSDAQRVYRGLHTLAEAVTRANTLRGLHRAATSQPDSLLYTPDPIVYDLPLADKEASDYWKRTKAAYIRAFLGHYLKHYSLPPDAVRIEFVADVVHVRMNQGQIHTVWQKPTMTVSLYRETCRELYLQVASLLCIIASEDQTPAGMKAQINRWSNYGPEDWSSIMWDRAYSI